jgi:hypothetical protein
MEPELKMRNVNYIVELSVHLIEQEVKEFLQATREGIY